MFIVCTIFKRNSFWDWGWGWGAGDRVLACITPALWKQGQMDTEDQRLKVILGYIASSKLAWAT